MTKVDIPASLDLLLGKISTEFDQAGATCFINELKRHFPTRKDSFNENDINGALKQLYKLGAIDDDGDQKLLEILVEKTSKKNEILNLISGYKESSSPRKDDFIGRDADVSKILNLVTDRRVPGVNLFGDSGVGKTTLAKAVSKRLEKDFEPFVINLQGTKDINTVYYEVLEKFKLTSWDYSKERIYTQLRNLTTKTLLVLDNVEQFLSSEKEVGQDRRKEFLEFLKTILSSEASKKGDLKVILTSRIQITDNMLKDIHFSEYELQRLTKEASRQLMSCRLKEEPSEEQDEALNEIADLCRNTPYLLKVAEQLLRQNYSNPSKVLEKLKTLKSKGVPEEYVSISLQFDSLPSDHVKQVAAKISLLRRPFSVSTAMKIVEIVSDYDAQLDLEMLAIHKIITAEYVNGKRKYDLHELFREFVTLYLCEEYPVYKDAYEKAENQFVEHFSKIFTQLTNNLDKDFVATYKELQEDKANLELLIELTTRKETFDLIVQSEDVKETGSVAILFEAFKSVKERRKLFGEWAKIMEKKESWLASTNFRCWESIQLADMEGTKSACEALNKAEMSLAKAILMSITPDKLKALKGLCKYCSGQIKCMTSANLIDKSSQMEKERLLEEALFDLKQSLAIHRKVYGDHTLTARTLNLIGNCYMECGEPNKALTFYQRAMDMKIKLVGSEKHFDIPTYYNQLSQVYEALGEKQISELNSWSFQSFANFVQSLLSQENRQNYQKAVDNLKKALKLQAELGVNDTKDTATFQRNLANILIGLGEYDQALENAKKCFEIRNDLLGKHPETVRILYLIGVIHEWRRDHEAALQSYDEAFVMEESLPEDNHSVVRKLLCDRLEEMCKKLNKKDELEKYKPRMDKIRKENDSDAGKKSDGDALAGESTDPIITMDDKGGCYDFSGDYFFLDVPRNAVDTPVKVKYKVDPCRCQPSMAGITTSVDYFLEMGSSMTIELNEPITVTLMHSGPGKEYGYTSTAMAFNQDKYVWEELKELRQGLPALKTGSIQVHVKTLPTILAVVTRLITDRFQVTPKGCVVRSSVCHDVTVEFPEGAVDRTVEGTMKLLLVTKDVSSKYPGIFPCPILFMEVMEECMFQKLVTVRVPHPRPEEYSTKDKLLLFCHDVDEWVDRTTDIELTLHESYIEFKVQHFSRYWAFVITATTAFVTGIVVTKMFDALQLRRSRQQTENPAPSAPLYDGDMVDMEE